MITTELLGTATEHGQVHLAHDAPDHRADERTTVCTDDSRAPKVITTVIGVVDEDGHEPLLAVFRALDLHPGQLCRCCFGQWVRAPYDRQWAARTSASSADLDSADLDADLDAVVVDTSVSAYVTGITTPERSGGDGFVVRVGGHTSRLFVEVANAAARATVRRFGWHGAQRSEVIVRGDEALASFTYRPHDTMVKLHQTGRLPNPAGTASPGRGTHRLGWETGTSGGPHGILHTSAEGTVTITLDGTRLIGIDLAAGQVLGWPDGEHAETVVEFRAERTSAFSPPFTWSTPSGEYRGISFSGTGREYIAVWRRDDTGAWRPFAHVDRAPAAANWMVAFDEWRMRETGFVMTHPYPAWTATHGEIRDVTGLPPDHSPHTRR